MLLARPLVVFDTETTGTHPGKDRIVQIGAIKVYPDGTESVHHSLINPEVAIPPESTKIHGVTDDMVATAPTFRDIAPKIAIVFRDADMCGYNVRFDKDMLIGEFRRVNFPLSAGLLDGHMIDPNQIYHQRERRNLKSAVERYCKRKMEGAHDARVDARETLNVLLAQLEEYTDLPRTVPELHAELFEKIDDGYADPDGKLCYRHGKLTINFGKWATYELEKMDNGFLRWILEQDGMNHVVKKIVKDLMKKRTGRG